MFSSDVSHSQPSSTFERFPHLKADKMAAIPSSGSLVATHDYYRREWGVYVTNYSNGPIIFFC